MPGFAWNDQLLSDVLWGLVVAAIVVPEFIVKIIGPAKWPPELLRERSTHPSGLSFASAADEHDEKGN